MQLQPGSHGGYRASWTRVALWVTLILGIVSAVAIGWRAAVRGDLGSRGYDLLGRWRAEETTILNIVLPVGLQLDFAPDAATVLDTRVPVSAYERDGDRVHVVVVAGPGVVANFTFRFETADRIIYEGPLGVNLKYRRVRSPS